MLHLDHTHHLSPKANLILQNDPLSPWPSLPATDEPRHHLDDIDDNAAKIHPDDLFKGLPTEPAPAHGPITPVDGTDPALPGTSPSSPADAHDDSANPPQGTHDTSTPPDDAQQEPDSVAELVDAGAVDDASRQSTPLSELTTAPEDDEPQQGDRGEKQQDGEQQEASTGNGASNSEEAPPTDRGDAASSPPSAPAMDNSDSNVDESGVQPTSPRADASEPSSSPQQHASSSAQDQPAVQSTTQIQPPPPPEVLASQDNTIKGSPSSSSQAWLGQSVQSSGSNQQATSLSNPDSKVVTILQLNSELLKSVLSGYLCESLNDRTLPSRVYMEFQARGIPLTDARCKQYASRIESNLAWLAAAHDENSKVGNAPAVRLPTMAPPPVVEFTSTERINQLYNHLPVVFARDIARSQKQHAGASLSRMASSSSPSLKRDRTEEPPSQAPDAAHKRRDMGESKLMPAPTPSAAMPPPQPGNMGMPSASTPSASTPIPNNVPMPMQNMSRASPTHSIGHSSHIGTPHVPSPSIPQPSASPTQNMDAARMRQMQQYRNMMQAQHGQAQQAVSHMSPPPGSSQQGMQGMVGGQNVPGNSSVPGMPNMHPGMPGPSSVPMNNGAPMSLTPQQIAALNSIGPNAVANFAILQNPMHPMIQLQRMQQLQAMAQQSQQNRQSMQGGGGGQMPGGLNPQQLAMQAMQQQQQQPQNTNMSANPQFLTGNGAGGNPMGMQSGMGQQQMSGHSPQGGQFPFGNNPNMSNVNMGGVAGPSGMGQGQNIPGMPSGINLNNLSPQQRQFLLMQQQARGSGGQNINPSMMNPQQYAQLRQQLQQQHAHQQQQMQGQAGSPPHSAGIGSPMVGPSHGAEGGMHPSLNALRSNSGAIPGIARSTRSPSDSGQSPMTPRVPMRAPSAQQMHAQAPSQDDYHRAMMQAQQAASARSGYVNPQQLAGGGGGNWQQQMGMGMAQGQGSYNMSQGHGGSQGGAMSMGDQSQGWSQGGANYPYNVGSPAVGGQPSMHQGDPSHSRATSSTPIPMSASHQYQHQQNNPQSGGQPGDNFDIFNWG
ncbi:hypothetical protein OE88DRAFT_721083 [Heliocybe sulcata]|uniref:Uncharacterized protein n=1 Tax=Heliocybe sulcata TaxID=5364 RepID=A0A5C3NIB3_9AGAM|nr:hypothetical protein OE88DRAFT_721083 [Heliocybe sulcata]